MFQDQEERPELFPIGLTRNLFNGFKMTEDKILDDLFRAAIRLRDADIPFCPICRREYNSFRQPQVSHFRKRRFRNTRWDVCNAFMGCSICNQKDNNNEAEAVLKARGIDTEAMKKKSLSYNKVDTDAVKEELIAFIGAHYKKKYSNLIPKSVQKLIGVHDS